MTKDELTPIDTSKYKITETGQVLKMTKEELEREYYGRRPTEPYSEDDSPNDWANIVQYAEENFDKAFKAIAELEKEKCELLGIIQGKDKVIQELEKENAELKANNQFLINLVREKEQRGLEIQEDLLRENEKLKEQCLILADCNTCHSTCKNENIEMKKQFTKAKELIDELEKENAKLKKQVENRNCSNCRLNKTGCPNDGSCHNFSLWQPFINPKLTKAKEIIKDYLTIAKGSHTTVCGVPEENRTIYVLKLNEEAEQFLNSEVEK